MTIEVRPYVPDDVAQMMDIWNEVVRTGCAFPQESPMDFDEAREFFAVQSLSSVAVEEGRVLGLYILHPNNIGRCGHIANASYAVSSTARNKGVGRLLVSDSLEQCPRCGFGILQFNAVVATNANARHLYESLGFKQLGTIPGGFHMPDGTYADICPYYHCV